ncbi:hypothetical protein B0T18DRAFT_428188 [Schizothecium vesticola]|uniref:FAD-binding domain-containing protein n=1 Tax=Schizothecium vesticola TaxID=314040 RepID=A0AA40K8V1_9PEZI|nr:hypothetical protein B0T18DRAFT_428188 [Schizothecium vesticola]
MAPAIAIICNGPCGLTLAHLLEYKGIDYVVYERDESKQSTGTGPSLNIRPETRQRALREGGLFDTFQKYARYEDTVFTRTDKSRKQLFQIGRGRDTPEINLQQLRQILLDAIPKDKIR